MPYVGRREHTRATVRTLVGMLDVNRRAFPWARLGAPWVALLISLPEEFIQALGKFWLKVFPGVGRKSMCVG